MTSSTALRARALRAVSALRPHNLPPARKWACPISKCPQTPGDIAANNELTQGNRALALAGIRAHAGGRAPSTDRFNQNPNKTHATNNPKWGRPHFLAMANTARCWQRWRRQGGHQQTPLVSPTARVIPPGKGDRAARGVVAVLVEEHFETHPWRAGSRRRGSARRCFSSCRTTSAVGDVVA